MIIMQSKIELVCVRVSKLIVMCDVWVEYACYVNAPCSCCCDLSQFETRLRKHCQIELERNVILWIKRFTTVVPRWSALRKWFRTLWAPTSLMQGQMRAARIDNAKAHALLQKLENITNNNIYIYNSWHQLEMEQLKRFTRRISVLKFKRWANKHRSLRLWKPEVEP